MTVLDNYSYASCRPGAANPDRLEELLVRALNAYPEEDSIAAEDLC